MKKAVITAVALTLVLCLAVGGTLAYLIDQTGEVKNTFTYGTVDIDLTETENLDLKMIPGKEITKDPEVTVFDDSEACYVFVKIEKSATYDSYLEQYQVAEGWTKLEENGTTAVYYRTQAAVSKGADDVKYPVLNGNKVQVKDTVTKGNMDDLRDKKVADPTLTFTAYAVQQDTLSVEQAWDLVN